MISISSFLMKPRMLMAVPRRTERRFYVEWMHAAEMTPRIQATAQHDGIVEVAGAHHADTHTASHHPVRACPGHRRYAAADPARQPVLPVQRRAAVGGGLGAVAAPALGQLAVCRLAAGTAGVVVVGSRPVLVAAGHPVGRTGLTGPADRTAGVAPLQPAWLYRPGRLAGAAMRPAGGGGGVCRHSTAPA
ncbi:hypothetical protein D3C71_1172350 [compost metagenome]